MERTLQKIDIADVLRLPKPTGTTVSAWSADAPETPALDASYVLPVWGMDILKWLVLHSEAPENLWLSGPTGCGKTAMIRWLAASVHAALYEVTGNERLEFPDLCGQWILNGRDMVWSDGPLTRAMREGGWLLINEADILSPGVLAGLNTVLDGGALTIPEHGSEIVRPAPGFSVIVTANSNGSGDSTGLYASVLRQNIALMDRFYTVSADYVAPAVEESILAARVPSLPEASRKLIVSVANDIRALFKGADVEGTSGSIDVTLSVRTSIRWARAAVHYAKTRRPGGPLGVALEMALLNRCSPATRQTIQEIFQRHTAEEIGGR